MSPTDKPDNSTRERIDALSDTIKTTSAEMQKEIDKRFDETKAERIQDKKEVSNTLKATEERHNLAQSRNQKRIAIYVAIAMALLGVYLESVRRELTSVTSEIKELRLVTSEQAKDTAVIKEKLNQNAEMRTLMNKMDTEMQSMRLEIERLKKQ